MKSFGEDKRDRAPQKREGEEEGERKRKRTKKISCPQCHHSNKAMVNFCTSCGTKLSKNNSMSSYIDRLRGENHQPMWIIVEYLPNTKGSVLNLGESVITSITTCFANFLGKDPTKFIGDNMHSLTPNVRINFESYVNEICEYSRMHKGYSIYTEKNSLVRNDKGELYNVRKVSKNEKK